jgi:hypothetical protein
MAVMMTMMTMMMMTTTTTMMMMPYPVLFDREGAKYFPHGRSPTRSCDLETLTVVTLAALDRLLTPVPQHSLTFPLSVTLLSVVNRRN